VGSTLALAHPLYYKRLVQLASTIFGTITDHEAKPTTDLARQEDKESDNKEKRDAKPSIATPIDKDLPRSFIPKAPYPERLKAPKKNVQFATILEVFKQVQINIPFLDAIQQVP
jgi:hypothetical protein